MTTTERVTAHLQGMEDITGVKCPDVAKALGVSDDVLYHRLKLEGSVYSEMFKAERQRRCSETLDKNPCACGQRLAQRCGFVSTNSFFRAFTEWYGMGLSEYRRRLG